MQFEESYGRRVEVEHRGQTEENKYLINTAKAIRGHKLKTKDFIRMQIMRLRKSSPSDHQRPPVLPGPPAPRAPRKPPMLRAPEPQGLAFLGPGSRDSAQGRIKLFNNSKLSSVLGEGPLSVGKPCTSQHYRQPKKYYSNHKTIAHESYSLEESVPEKKKRPLFRSENLGLRMNDYLNCILGIQQEQQTTEPRECSQPKWIDEQPQSQTIEVFRTRGNPAFLRKMKKQHRSRAEDFRRDMIQQFKSEQLVKSSTAQPAGRPRRPREE